MNVDIVRIVFSYFSSPWHILSYMLDRGIDRNIWFKFSTAYCDTWKRIYVSHWETKVEAVNVLGEYCPNMMLVGICLGVWEIWMI